jgi:tricorn protease
MIRTILAFAGLILAFPVSAQEPIRFPRTPDISPDGKLIAFSYLGDIWTVEAIGGGARPVTMHEAHDYTPVFSPDGRQIAFSSNRHGSYDVFVVPTQGGKPKRLTFDSGSDVVSGWTPDGRNIIFSSTRSASFPSNPEMFTVPVDGGAEKKLNFFEAKDLTYSPVGDKVAFVRGPGTWYRRGYRGSSNDDIYLATADGNTTRRLSSFDGQDTAPMFSPDGKKLFYVTEQGFAKGCANIVCQPLDGITSVGEPKAITTHSEDTVRRARISGNGEWIVYECGGDIWVTSTRSGNGRKVAIEVHADDKSNTERTLTFTKDATDYALSPDESQAVIVVHGQLFLTKVPQGGKSVRLTHHGFADHNPSFSPDGKKILFASDRSGVEELYMLESDDAENADLGKAHKFKTTQLTKTPAEEVGASFIPKSDRIGFLRQGQLWTMKADGSDQKVLIAEKKVTDYEWSPDGKYVAYSRMDGSFASEVYIASLDGSIKPVNVSRYAIYNSDISWGGSKISFVSQRKGVYSMHVLSLQKPVQDGPKPPEGEIDWDDLHLRVERVALMGADSGVISIDGGLVAFRSSSSDGGDLWVVTSDGKALTRITTGGQSPRGIRWSKRNAGTIFFLNSSGELRSARANPSPFASPGAAPAEPAKIPFQAKLSIQRDEEYAEMFAQAWRALSDHFYDSKYHGADWNAVKAKYAPMVAHCSTREDLYALVSLMLGELNASHLGISGKLPTAEENTADLGLLFDDSFAGPGLKISEVLKRGPADKRNLNIKPGDVITQIDRIPLTAQTNLSQLLNNRTGDTVTLTLETGPIGMRTARKVDIVAVPRDRTAQLMYERWVAKNAEAVAKQSNGKLGYIHIPSMDEAGLEVFMRSLYSDNFDKEGLIIDVRYNGGGFTHDQVLNYLTGKEHTLFRQRDGGEGFVLRNFDRKFAKPVTVLINNGSYSDAEIFPHAFRASGHGKLVGQATGGLVIGTGSARLIDGSQFRIPRIGVFTNKNENMDKVGVKPDFPIEITPEDWKKGVDSQLGKAVEVVGAEVAAKKKAAAATETTTPKPTPGG